MIIAIDGPAGSGKSTVAKQVAQRLGFSYVDTGAMYRAITADVLEQGITPFDTAAVIEVAKRTNLDQIDDSRIRSEAVSRLVSQVAKIPEVREMTVAKQREMANHQSIVMEGRDIGSVVFPQAELKIYLNASVQERARRRFEELKARGESVELCQLIQSIQERDRMDQERAHSPLRKLPSAIEVDTTGMTIPDVVEEICRLTGGKTSYTISSVISN